MSFWKKITKTEKEVEVEKTRRRRRKCTQKRNPNEMKRPAIIFSFRILKLWHTLTKKHKKLNQTENAHTVLKYVKQNTTFSTR